MTRFSLKFAPAYAVAAAALALTGCGTINSGTTQQVQVSSNPAGATVYTALKTTDSQGQVSITNKVAVGTTPLTVTLSRKHGALFVQKAGFVPTEVPLTAKMNPWMWGNIALGSPLSTSIDTSTGASREYDPGEYMIDLQPVAR
ncbi:hypothetical protein HF313_05745 [Massilia atriviolacea]|uniref:PEGA domain-containing protein n=1 Tax=Massilia atriviolacea TaxID=2495579 RepID=A0A430HH52_9BURK|nr:hypothetical protein [Massilia atriviolacea]RSZ56858.1 hypothetical protein EJB06_21190 [Massilia atriviolacea]